MEKLLRGVSVPRLPVLGELLWEWAGVIERTTRFWTDEDDSAWLYNERASLSVLAGAVWRIGGIAFEEYSHDKHRPRESKGKPSGRCDIYFQLGSREFIAEVKQCWPSLGRRGTPQQTVGAKLELARHDALRLKRYTYERLAITFVAPYLSKGEEATLDARLSNWLRAVRRIPHDCLAWCFPLQGRKKCFKGYIYPGIALLVSKVDRKTTQRGIVVEQETIG